MRGIRKLLDQDDGVFITESHYLLDVVEKNQFDTVYHEHIRTYSLRSLVALFAITARGLRRAPGRRYGAISGLRRAQGKAQDRPGRQGAARPGSEYGLFEKETYVRFRSRVEEQRDKLMTLSYQAHQKGLHWSETRARAAARRC